MNTISYSRVVDLSHVIHPGMPAWTADPPVVLEQVASLEKQGYNLRRFSMSEHGGTHLNAPIGFCPGGTTVDTYPSDLLVLPAVILDIRNQVRAGADCQLSTEKLLAWEEQYGPIPAGSLAVLYTGWQARWQIAPAFFGEDAQGGLHFPGFGLNAARFLSQERGVAGIGTDAPGVDPGRDPTFAVNRLLAKTGALDRPMIVLECLNHLDQLPATGATVVIGILRLKGGTGSPASVMVFLP